MTRLREIAMNNLVRNSGENASAAEGLDACHSRDFVFAGILDRSNALNTPSRDLRRGND